MSATASKPAKKKSSLIPLGDRVVVEREESEQKTAGGILLPDSAKDKPARGTVVSVGEGKFDSKGNRHPLQVKPGDRVVFTSYAGEAFKVGDDELLLLREDDILAVLGCSDAGLIQPPSSPVHGSTLVHDLSDSPTHSPHSLFTQHPFRGDLTHVQDDGIRSGST